mmetsp:Transcript_34953/g.104268  ORF Transcript_34953/g.104268 Transcript_34953/m.104268 type:complete len:232 (+) Transcript_34953:1366-2061(+)
MMPEAEAEATVDCGSPPAWTTTAAEGATAEAAETEASGSPPAATTTAVAETETEDSEARGGSAEIPPPSTRPPRGRLPSGTTGAGPARSAPTPKWKTATTTAAAAAAAGGGSTRGWTLTIPSTPTRGRRPPTPSTRDSRGPSRRAARPSSFTCATSTAGSRRRRSRSWTPRRAIASGGGGGPSIPSACWIWRAGRVEIWGSGRSTVAECGITWGSTLPEGPSRTPRSAPAR